MSKHPKRAALPSFVQVAGALPVDLFRALGDPNRIALVAWLAKERAPRTVSEIAAGGCCSVDFSVVSRHLKTLRDAGIIEAERHGREVLYKLRVDSLAGALRKIADLLESCCAPVARGSKEEP